MAGIIPQDYTLNVTVDNETLLRAALAALVVALLSALITAAVNKAL